MRSDPLLGRVIDNKYQIDAEIGAGGMATIYRATRLKIGDVVAIKILHAELLREPKFAERFQREAQAAARLKHPNVVTVHDFGVSEDGVIYLVMELVEGRNLRTIIKDEGPMTTAAAAAIVRQVCAALTEAHRQGVIHRDIKPANIAVDMSPDGVRVKVLDFGIASLLGGTMMTFTQTGAVMGTPAYMSPEQCLGEELDGRSDIYSLGVVLFEMLAGVVPFNSPTATAVVMQHVQQAPPPLRVLNVSISAAVEDVVLRALAKRREDRPQLAKDLAEELSAAVAGIGPLQAGTRTNVAADRYSPNQFDRTMAQSAFRPPEKSAVPAHRSHTMGIVTGLALAAVLGAIWFGVQRLSSAKAPSTAAATAKPAPAQPAIAQRTNPPLRAVPANQGALTASQAHLSSSSRYAVNGCGAIADSTTGLEWLLGPDNDFTWEEARAWADSASACGGGWEMPSIRQLAGLYDPRFSTGIGYYRDGAHYPAHIEPVFAAIGNGSWVWSRESVRSDTARSFNFNQGIGVTYEKGTTIFPTRVFAVRSARRSDAGGGNDVLSTLEQTREMQVLGPSGCETPNAVRIRFKDDGSSGCALYAQASRGMLDSGANVLLVPVTATGRGLIYDLLYSNEGSGTRFIGILPGDGSGDLTVSIENGLIVERNGVREKRSTLRSGRVVSF